MLLGAWHSGIWSQVLLNISAIVNRPGFHAPSGFWEPALGGRRRSGGRDLVRLGPVALPAQVCRLSGVDMPPLETGITIRKREPESGRYYQLLSDETERLNRLVESLLSFGRIKAGAYAWQLDRPFTRRAAIT